MHYGIPSYAKRKAVTIPREQKAWLIRQAENRGIMVTTYLYQILTDAVHQKIRPSIYPRDAFPTKDNVQQVIRIAPADLSKIEQNYVLTDYVRRVLQDKMNNERN